MTPIGTWRVLPGFYRGDRWRKPCGGPGTRQLRADDGWCDSPDSGRYNRHVRLPFASSHESMWRRDSAYDVVFPTDHNLRPRIRGLGSAIFFHLIRDGAEFTEGCIAVSAEDMRKILSLCGRKIRLKVWPN